MADRMTLRFLRLGAFAELAQVTRLDLLGTMAAPVPAGLLQMTVSRSRDLLGCHSPER